MNNILITGACGYIGSHFTKLMLESKKYNLFAIDDLSTGVRSSISEKIPLLQTPLENTLEVENFIRKNKIDSIFHFAGKIVVSESVENPYKYYSSNTVNTLNLAKIASDCEVQHFIFSSTAAVYGEPKQNEKVSETSDKNPISPYGKSKLFSENIIADICKSSEMKFAILRYFNVAGASEDLSIGQQTPNPTHLIKMCCNVVLGKAKKLSVFGNDYPTKDGTGIRDYIHVCDLASAHNAVYEYLLNGGDSDYFNIGYGVGYSVMDVIKAFEHVTGRQIDYDIKPRRLGDAACVVSANEKILNKTNWKPTLNDIHTIVKHAYLWDKSISNSNKDV